MKNSSNVLLILSACALCASSATAQQQADSTQSGTQNSSAASSNTNPGDKKTKKVWTDDDLHGLGGVSVVGDTKSGAKGHASPNNGKDGTAANYKQQLAKLQAQLDDVTKKLAELRSFNGDSNTDTAIQTNHRLSRGSISDQIAQLETKKSQLSEQMQKIFDEARHNGIEPGALR
jgi:TolA-binding protein